MEFLVNFNTSAKVVTVSNTNQLKNEVKSAFGIDVQDDIILQRYDSSWDDFIDLNESELIDLPGRQKLKCILMTQQTDSLVSESQPSTPKSPSLSEVSNFSTPSTCSDKQASEKWPDEFHLPVNKYSRQLKKSTSEDYVLSWSCKHEMLGIIVDEVFRYTFYPNNLQIRTVAKSIIKTHPNLTEKIGSGYDGWAQSLRDKLKNARRSMDIPVVTWRKRKTNQTDVNERSKKARKIRDVHSIPFPTGEDETTCKMHVETLKKEMKNPQRDTSLVKKLMKTTYAYRRSYVLGCPTVSAMLLEYPALRIREILHEEMFLMKEKEAHTIFCDNVTTYSASLLQLAKKKTAKLTVDILEHMDRAIQDLVDVTPKDIAEHEAMASVLVIPPLLGEEPKMFINQFDEGTPLNDYIKSCPRSPHVAVAGKLFQSSTVHMYTVAEGEVVTTCSKLGEALYDAFCLYYIFNIDYPVRSKNSWAFVQHVLMEIQDDKPPKKVLTLRGKL